MTEYVLSRKDESDDKVENDRDDGDYGCKEPDWEIKFNNIMDEKWGVKLSPEEESNSSMKSNEEGLTKDRGSMSLIHVLVSQSWS